jgi:predicted transcriptional regulator
MTMNVVSITLDPSTQKKLDSFSDARAIARSVAIRLILNEFFLKKEGAN